MGGNRRIVLITGATTGLGLALAQQYRDRDAQLILVGRRPLHELDAALFTPSTYCRADLARPDAGSIIDQFLHENDIDRLDLLINNAAIGYYGPVKQQPVATVSSLIDVNLRAPVALTHQLLRHIVAAHGRIVFISSVVATLPAPDYAVYAATKAALEAFARNLRVELGSSATVQIIAPGAIRTALHERSGAPLATLGWDHFPSPDVVARRIVRVIERRRTDATIGVDNALLRFAGWYLPRLVDRIAAGRRR